MGSEEQKDGLFHPSTSDTAAPAAFCLQQLSWGSRSTSVFHKPLHKPPSLKILPATCSESLAGELSYQRPAPKYATRCSRIHLQMS
jgi:hypothetical protein